MTTPLAQPVRLDSGANRKLWIAYLLWFPLGLFGVHRFYLRRTGSAFIYMITVGWFMVGWAIDGFRLPKMVRKLNAVGY